ncbi:MAG: hypothetical protein QOD72_323 [Acidimicrobiaceae bacterium]|nr:hypothetical protein [Acidimicrobiaceae bacterium]
MTPLILLLIGVMWAVVLLPPLLRSRSDGRPSTSIVGFQRQLSSLQRTRPGAAHAPYALNRPMVGARRPVGAVTRPTTRAGMAPVYRPAYRPLSRRELAKRRRQHVFVLLGAAAAATLVGYLATGNSRLFAFHMVADLILAGYVYLLVQIRRMGELRSARADWYHAA